MTSMAREAGTFAALQQIIGSITGGDHRLELDTHMADVPRWDSHATVEIIFAVEDHFGFQMTSAEMERIDGVRALMEILTSRSGVPA